ncbi:FAD-linked oxidoreductase [Ramaria rubella]|nr:FAD-linked oxidoreductase [Ramaria rubella]
MLPLLRCSSRLLSSKTVCRFAHSSSHRAVVPRITPTGIALLSCGIIGGTLYLKHSNIHADASLESDSRNPRRRTALSSLLRSYLVYTFCSIPDIVDYSPTLLATLTTIPGIKNVTEAVVRSTFFAQFVGGDSAEDTIPLLIQMREENKGVLLAYSVEVDQDEAERRSEEQATNGSAVYKDNVEETLRCIDVAADFEDRRTLQAGLGLGKKTWVAVKLTALLPSAQSLIKLSDHLREARPGTSPPVPFPGCPHPSDLAFIESGAPHPVTLSKADVDALKDLYHDLDRIAHRAAQRGVKIIVDAEYSWYQPAIDAFTLSLMRRFNKLQKRSDATEVQPLIYATFQAYLKRTPSHILQSFKDAKAGGYSLGVKLVRGAYHPFEIEASPSPEACPVWSKKEDTDSCYNESVGVLLSALKDDIIYKTPRLGILFGTHNSRSCAKIMEGLVHHGIAKETDGLVIVGDAAAERCAIGQLFGMSDALTNHLVDKIRSPSPFVIKYVPYGPLSAVMPYLSRRAIENKSVLSGEGGAVAERRRVGAEIRRRLLGF